MKSIETLIQSEIAAGQHVTLISNSKIAYSHPNFVQREIPAKPSELRGIHYDNNTVIYADLSPACDETHDVLQNIFSDKNPKLIFVQFK